MPTTFTVRLIPDPASGYLTAGIVTEAENRAALIKRVWAVAPEMYELCGYGTADDRFHLHFHD